MGFGGNVHAFGVAPGEISGFLERRDLRTALPATASTPRYEFEAKKLGFAASGERLGVPRQGRSGSLCWDPNRFFKTPTYMTQDNGDGQHPVRHQRDNFARYEGNH